MKDVADLLLTLSKKNIKVWVERGSLNVDAPKGILTSEDREHLRNHKDAIFTFLEKVNHDVAPVAIQRCGDRSQYPLSRAQQRLWFIDQLSGAESAAYHISGALRIKGALDVEALRAALDTLVERHEALRTVFGSIEDQPIQVILETARFALAAIDLSHGAPDESEAEVERQSAEEAQTAFDLSSGPLIRGRLLKLSVDEHVLLITMHHIVSDGWSLGILIRELGELYAAYREGRSHSLMPLPIRYVDFAVWQRERLQADVLQEQVDYWKKQLTGAPALLSLPADRTRPAVRSYRGSSVAVDLGPELTDQLKTLSKQHGTTLFMTLYAGFAILLSRLSAQQDVVIGTPTANRQPTEIEGLIGFFVNALPLRARLDDDPSVSELLARVKELMLGAYSHQETPFELIVEALQPARSSSYAPIFQVMFALQNAPSSALQLSDLTIARQGRSIGTAQFDVSLSLQETGDRITGWLNYATDLFDRETIERWVECLQIVLAGVVADAERRISELRLLGAQARQQVIEGFNATTVAYPKHKCIHELFAEQVERNPNAVAVICEGQQLTYGELSKRANQLAHYLMEQGVEVGEHVALLIERSIELVIAELAVLKCGAAYVPLDSASPAERQAFMVRDCGARFLLSGRDVSVSDALKIRRINVDESSASESQSNPRLSVESEACAYVMYTSGSTGEPKGVVIPHRAISRLVLDPGYVQFEKTDRIAFVANPAFDASTFEVWGALLNGGSIVVITKAIALEPAGFSALLKEQRVTAMFLTASLFNQCVRSVPDSFASLKYVLIGGESLDPQVLKLSLDAGPPENLLNVYGPTETTTFASFYRIESVAEDAKSIPIGRPISNTQIYILDRSLQPVPIGVAGEIYIGGAGVARGYLHRPELTAERFIQDPFSQDASARLYRTGDLGRWRADGNIEFLGRNDFQVKIRGFRIELGEIEASLSQCAGVKEAVVLAREDAPGEKRLVAYVTSHAGVELSASELRSDLSGVLAEYMVPSAFVILPSLPLTPNGKLDRKALPAPDQSAVVSREYAAPVGAIEEALASIWRELLHVERVGRHDNFFELGGHSLLAVRVMVRVRQTLEVELSLRELFNHPTLGEFAQVAEQAKRSVQSAIVPVDRSQALPVSYSQQRLWFLAQLDQAAGAAYHMPVALRLQGALSPAALQAALNRMVWRHESLRTRFASVEGQTLQIIAPADSGFALREQALNELAAPEQAAAIARISAEEARAPFELSRGPLIRGQLLKLKEEEHILLVTQHHIISDGWSIGIMVRELSALYAAFSRGERDPLPALSIQYADYAVWQRSWLQGAVLQGQTEYWKQQLSGAPGLLALPSDRPRPAVQSYAGGQVQFELSAGLTAGLRELSQRHGLTLFMTLLSGWALLLSRLSGQLDIVIGTPVANRQRSEIESLIGFFVNTLALRVDLSDDPTVGELLAQVKRTTLGAYEHQDVPFDQVVEALQPARSMSYSPVFQSMLSLNNTPYEGVLRLPGLTLSAVEQVNETTQFDLSVSLTESGEQVYAGLSYASDLFDAGTIERYAGYLQRLLSGMVAQEQRRVSELNLLDEREERRVLREFNDTAVAYSQDRLIHELFEEQAALRPEAVAVVYEEEELSYRELNERANRLAHELREVGIKPDARVALCMERGIEMIVGVLGILKAGGAYVPLDPSYPAERLNYMLSDCAPLAVVTQQALKDRVSSAVPLITLDAAEDRERIASRSASNLDASASGLNSTHLAYVIYTSGSTGTPKGVMVEHRQVARLFAATDDWFRFDHNDVWTFFHSLAFDFSVWEIWGALLKGGRLIVVPYLTSRSPRDFYELLSKQGVTILNQTPSAFRQLIAAQVESQAQHQLRCVIFGGEALEPATLQPWYRRPTNKQTCLINMYGITETTVHVTYRPLDRADAKKIGTSPIGRPIPDLRIYILDSHRQLVPIGVSGEMFVGGAGVARGYLNRSELTAERFVKDPFSEDSAARMYKTGDLGRWRADGSIEYLGRNDFQVKIRGFRIELGEIEARLIQCAGVKEAVMLAREDAPGEKRLVAYVTAHAGVELSASELRSELSTVLSDYMVPSAFVILDSLPLTPNGKLDHKALPAADDSAYASRSYQAPVGKIEVTLCDICREVLGLERVGVNDNFFEIGGDSIRSISIVAKANEQGLTLAIVDLFKYPTIADLARVLSLREANLQADCQVELLNPADRAALPSQIEDAYPVTLLQLGMVFHNEQEQEAGLYHDITTHHLILPSWEADTMRIVLDALSEKHAALRTAFDLHGYSEPLQMVHARAPIPMTVLDISDVDADAQDRIVAQFIRDEHKTKFDLAAPPLLRIFIHVRAPRVIQFTLSFHHAILDGWSLASLQTALFKEYIRLATLKKTRLTLAPLSLTPKLTVAQERQALQSQEHKAFWTDYLDGYEFCKLPTAIHESDVAYSERRKAARLSEDVCAKLQSLATRLGVPMRSVLLCAHMRMVAMISGSDDVTTGLVTNVRPEKTDGDNVLGLFLNTLPFRQKLHRATWKELIEAIHENELKVMEYRHYPYFQLYLDNGRQPFYDITFNYINFHIYESLDGVLERGTFNRDVELTSNAIAVDCLYSQNREIQIKVDAGKLSGAQEDRIRGYFVSILEAMANQPDSFHDELCFLSDGERRSLLIDFNDTAVVNPQSQLIHQSFEAQAAAQPDAIALVHGEQTLTYGQLNRRANQLAHRLLNLGVRPDDRVAICIERGFDMIVGLLGILKAGGAYVPLDPQYPNDRLGYMLRDSAPAALISQTAVIDRLPFEGLPIIALDAPTETTLPASDLGNPDSLALKLNERCLAYVIYTSGSTGLPKGVMVEHGNVGNLTRFHIDTCELTSSDRVLQFASFGFDNSITEIFPTLAVGARIVLRPAHMVVPDREFIAFANRHSITVADLPTSFWQLWASEIAQHRSIPGAALRLVIVGGEKAEWRHLQNWLSCASLRAVRWLNTYGPTEATVYTTAIAYDDIGNLSSREIPIGRPIANTQIRILDKFGQLTPLGVAGEIHIGGAQVTRGYLDRPELTAERFIPDEFSDSDDARLYKTGDVGRWMPDGTVEFLGRNDFQVKIRGHRIEIGEIETRLATCRGVREAVVLAREDAQGDVRLVAYLIARDGMSPTVELRGELLAMLPEYMVPSAFVVLDAFPLTPNGKLDRKALPAPDQSSVVSQKYEEPQGRIEITIATIWKDLLDLEQVGRHDHFFELGGHSLMVVSLIEQLRQQGLSAQVRDVFDAPTLVGLADLITGAKAGDAVTGAPPNLIRPDSGVITPDMLPLVKLTQADIDGIVDSVPGGIPNIQDIYPLAPLQTGILFHNLLQNEGDPYLLRLIMSFDSRDRLDVFLNALQRVIDRHDILRSAFVWQELSEPVQVVYRHATLPVSELILSSVEGALPELLEKVDPRRVRLDLRSAPLLAAYIAADPGTPEWHLALLNHHLIGDHVSLDIVVAEVQAIMQGRGDTLPVPASYRDFIARTLDTNPTEDKSYFQKLLGEIDQPTAPFDLLDVQGSGTRAQETLLELSSDLALRIRAMSRQLGMTPAVLFHVAWAQVLSRCCQRDDVVFGTVLFGRMRGSDRSDQVVGMFMNTLPVRISIAGAGVKEIADRTYRQLTELLTHEQASLAMAQRCSGVAAPLPVFTTLLNYRHIHKEVGTEREAAELTWHGIRTLAHEERINYPIGVSINDLGEDFSISAQCEGVDPARIAAMFAQTVEALIGALEQEADARLDSIDVLPSGERHQLLFEFNDTSVVYPQDRLLQELFEEQAALRPEAVAVVYEEEQLSYRELNERANRLAHELRELGVKPDARVALCLERGVEMIVGVLGILKAGGAYVPLDPSYPAERLNYMLSDCAPLAVVTQAALKDRLPPISAPILVLNAAVDRARIESRSASNLDASASGLKSTHLAYVIYTSGSTGLPKGVMIEHRSVMNFLSAMTHIYELTDRDSMLAVTTLSFDIAALEIYLPLICGARVVLASRATATDAERLAQMIEKCSITMMQATPVTWRMLLDEGWQGAANFRALCGGEALSADLARRLGERVGDVWNLYGPTETTIWSACRRIEGEWSGPIESIGRPISNTQIYILDRSLQPVPMGVAGEIYIGGAGVARGYLHRPELTAERFIKDPFSQDVAARMYKTGDLGRWRADGNIEFLGRNDFQVKIRGFRIELGEIEARMSQCAGVKDAVVLAREDSPGDKRLVAYLTAREGVELSASELRSELSGVLAEYMVPSAFVILPSLPLTPNGKLDRKALPAPDQSAVVSREYAAPVGAIESALAGIWQELLHVERVGRHDNFFELGGHSLTAVRVVVRARQTLDVELSLKELFNHPTLAEFAQVIGQARHSVQGPLLPADRNQALPVSYSQQRLWFLDRLDHAAGAAYHMPAALRLEGALNREALQSALNRIVARHESLRTRFAQVEGQMVQVIAPVDTAFALSERDLSERSVEEQSAAVARISAEEVGASFDLATGPLIRGQLLRLGEREHILLVTQHHIISDGWSIGIMVRELSALYAAFSCGESDPLPALAIQYADYAVWQRDWLQGEVLQAQTDFWKEHLSGAPALLELPTDRSRPAKQSYAGGQVRFELSAELTAGLRELSQRHGTTLFMTLLSGWAILLGRLSGQQDVVIGTPVANRQRSEIESVIGFFVNTLALRVHLADDPTVEELLARVKLTTLSAYEHQDVPFDQVVEAVQPPRSMSYSPVFQSMMTLNNLPFEGVLRLPGLTISGVEQANDTTQFDLSVSLTESAEKLFAALSYASDLFDVGTVERVAGYLQNVLDGMVTDTQRRVSELPLMSEAERYRLVHGFNDTRVSYPQDRLVHQLFEAQVELRPEAVAVAYEGQELSYRELNERANRLAHHLRELGVRCDERVALCMERDIEMVVGLLGILKAGAAYVPLDPKYPVERLKYMVSDSAPAVVLTQEALRDRLPSVSAPIIALDASVDRAQIAARDAHNLDPSAIGLLATHLAYVIYTSGSTGTPKGVMVEHRGLCNLARAQMDSFAVNATSRVLQVISLSFDVSLSEITMALCSGARLQLASRSALQAGEPLLATLRTQRITHVTLPKAVLAVLPSDADLGDVHTVITGGEVLPPALADAWSSRYRLFNSYGPTEATICASEYACRAPHQNVVPIGRPLANTQIYILDAHGAPVPIGVTGEIHIGGAGLARGYLNRPELTAERFIENPFSQDAARMYKTGDLGRWRADGNIEFLGRNDFQVKIRGLRIELGEIEAALSQCAGVKDAVVLAREDVAGEKRLVAYVTAREGGELSTGELRSELSAVLAEYMVPSAFVILASLPLTPNGKLDRKALPAVDGSTQTEEYTAPRNVTEQTICRVWAELLHLDRVGINDNFFDLGGHSLLIVKLHHQLETEFPGRLTMADLFTHTTVAKLANYLRAEKSEYARASPGISRAETRRNRLAVQKSQRLRRGGKVA